MMRGWIVLMLAMATPVQALPLCDVEASDPAVPGVLSLRDRAALQNDWLRTRLDTLVPQLMRAQGIDMWVLVAREYLEDPVVATMLDATSLRARRRTILVFYDPGQGKPIERLTVSRYGMGGLFTPSWEPATQPDQWARLAELIAARDPKRIAINISPATAFADGLTVSQYQGLGAALAPQFRSRLAAGDALAIGWLETRTPAEMARYPEIVRIAHAIIAESLSETVITPGRTTAEDVQWWQRERISELKLSTWFHPSVAVMRAGVAEPLEGDVVIQPGDMLWTDFGITYLGLNTDTQHLAYVLRPGERDAPAGLNAGMRAANQVQDAVAAAFKVGTTGNAILAAARATATAQGLVPTIYSHPLGYHGHGAGSAIGFWDNQAGDARGSWPIHAETGWSIELSARAVVPEWQGQAVDFRLEDDAFFDGTRLRFIDGRQTAFHLIPRVAGQTAPMDCQSSTR